MLKKFFSVAGLKIPFFIAFVPNCSLFIFKGFCLPKEFMEDAAGEGATEFHDYEGGGIGEGEGVKDVSDQIENEEQVRFHMPEVCVQCTEARAVSPFLSVFKLHT